MFNRKWNKAKKSRDDSNMKSRVDSDSDRGFSRSESLHSTGGSSKACGIESAVDKGGSKSQAAVAKGSAVDRETVVSLIDVTIARANEKDEEMEWKQTLSDGTNISDEDQLLQERLRHAIHELYEIKVENSQGTITPEDARNRVLEIKASI